MFLHPEMVGIDLDLALHELLAIGLARTMHAGLMLGLETRARGRGRARARARG